MSSNLTFLPPIFPLPLLGSPRKSDSPGGKRGLVCARKGGREGKLATRKSEKGKGKDVHGKTNFRERRRRQQEEEERIFAPRGEEKEEEEEETVLYSFPSFSFWEAVECEKGGSGPIPSSETGAAVAWRFPALRLFLGRGCFGL